MKVTAVKYWFWRRAYLSVGMEYDLPDEDARILIQAGAVVPKDSVPVPQPVATAAWRSKRGRNRIEA